MKFREYIAEDKRVRDLHNPNWLREIILHDHSYSIWSYQMLLRREEYHLNRGNRLLALWYRRRKNRMGEKLGFTIESGVFGSGLRIWHYGNIVVNGCAKVGRNCILHGDNCIGNNGLDNRNPVIGDNVDIGVGAKIIGDVRVGNNVIIAAGAVVVRSIEEDNVVIAGVPAKIVKRL